jgi:hypothetical protein
MKLHEDKFVFVNYNTRINNFSLANLPFFGQNFQYSTNSAVLEPSNTVLDLGVTFDDDLKWHSHVGIIVKSAKRKAGWCLSIFKDRSPYVMLTLYKSMIRSLLEYACPLWTGLDKQSMCQLESLQRYFTNKIECPSYVCNYWDRLQYLNLMSLQRRRERYVILHIWKILHDLTNNDLNISFYSSYRFGLMANVPSLNTSSTQKAQTIFDSSFAVKGPQLWNLVPKEVKEKESLFTFKIDLDIFLRDIPDRHPVPGYSIQNNNSLLEWNYSRFLD